MESQAAPGTQTRNGKAVSTTNSSLEQRTIDPERYERALTETKSVTFTGPGIAEVEQGVTAYQVELGSGRCECDDYRFRGEDIICKHAIRASIAALFADDQRSTELVAKVARYATEQGCAVAANNCNGPVNGADKPSGLPCTTCMDALRSESADEWDAWVAFGRAEVAR